MKTISQALIDEIHYPLGEGYVENVVIKRGLLPDEVFTEEVANSDGYKGAVADCFYSLIHSVNFSEGDKSIGSLSDSDKKRILAIANSIYSSIGEPIKNIDTPKVYIGWP